MRNLFFFGTLRHLPLLEIVLGHDLRSITITPATLHGYKVSSVVEGPFPMIEKVKGAVADGVFVQGLNEADVERLDYYERSFGYDLAPVTLGSGDAAESYLPRAGLWTGQGSWSIEEWAQDWATLSCHAASEVMGYMGRLAPSEIARIFPRIRARAASKVRAAKSKHGERTMTGRVDVENITRPYLDYYALDDIQLRHVRFDGAMSDSLDRAVFVATDAAIVLPYDPARDRVLLVEQIRMGPILRGDVSNWQLEPIAGGIDPGETPQEAAHREAMEEAGLTLRNLETIAEVYPTPGTSTEFYYIFAALADLPDDSARIGGLEAEDEDIRSHILSFDELMDMVQRCAVANAPLVTATYWLAHHRDRLRLAGTGGTPDAT